jgi:MFS family permease
MLQSMRVYPAFRLLMLGTLASSSAFWMYQVAVGWLALQMTDSPFFVGMAGFAGGIPLLLISLPAGVIIDRYDRRVVLMLAQVGVLTVSALFAVLVGTDIIEPWSMLVLVATYGTVMSFIFPTRTAIVPSLVERRDLANAIALNAAGQNATRVIGPSLAGVLIGVLDLPATFAFAAVLQAFALLATSRLPSIASEVAARGISMWASLTVGLRIVAQSPHLMALIILALAPTVLVMPYINLMPVFARDELGMGSSGLGILLASTGLGTVAGSLSVARAGRGVIHRGVQLTTAVAFAVAVLLFAMTPLLLPAVLLLFLAGWTSAAFMALNQTALQLSVDDDVRGRVISIYLLTWGVLPFGQLLVGALANTLGTPLALAASCAAALACIAFIAQRFPSLRR